MPSVLRQDQGKMVVFIGHCPRLQNCLQSTPREKLPTVGVYAMLQDIGTQEDMFQTSMDVRRIFPWRGGRGACWLNGERLGACCTTYQLATIESACNTRYYYLLWNPRRMAGWQVCPNHTVGRWMDFYLSGHESFRSHKRTSDQVHTWNSRKSCSDYIRCSYSLLDDCPFVRFISTACKCALAHQASPYPVLTLSKLAYNIGE